MARFEFVKLHPEICILLEAAISNAGFPPEKVMPARELELVPVIESRKKQRLRRYIAEIN